MTIVRDEPIYEDLCPRPDRKYQRLKYGLIREGVESGPSFLLALDPCTCLLEEGVLVMRHAPALSLQRAFPLRNFERFVQNVKKFDEDIARIRRGVEALRGQLGIEEVDSLLFSLLELFSCFYRYMFHCQFIDEFYAGELMKLLRGLPRQDAEMLHSRVLSSAFSRSAIASGRYITLSKNLSLSPAEIVLWEGEIELVDDRLERLAQYLGADVLPEAQQRLVVICNLVYQCAEAFAFGAHMLTAAASNVMALVGSKMVEGGALGSAADLLGSDLELVLAWARQEYGSEML